LAAGDLPATYGLDFASETRQTSLKVSGEFREMRFAPGHSGNPSGKPPGTRSRRALLVENLFEGEVEQVARKAVDMALGGNIDCLRLILDRVAPARRDRPVRFPLPNPPDADALLRAVARGHLTPMEAGQLAPLVQPLQAPAAGADGTAYVLNVSLKSPPLPMHAAAAPDEDDGFDAAPLPAPDSQAE
jgi:hypothetical protein